MFYRLLLFFMLCQVTTPSSALEIGADSGEPCQVLKSRNEGVSWGAYTALPIRCVPMHDRVAKVYAPRQQPREGFSCLNDIYYDQEGNAGFVCTPVTVIAKWTRNKPCTEDDAKTTQTWARKFCRGQGTGLLHCDDGKIALDTDAQLYCHITLSEHVQ